MVSALSKVTDLILSVLNFPGTGDGKQMEDGLIPTSSILIDRSASDVCYCNNVFTGEVRS